MPVTLIREGPSLRLHFRVGPPVELRGPGWLYEYVGDAGFLHASDDQGERWRARVEAHQLVLVGRELDRITFDLRRCHVTAFTVDGTVWRSARLEPDGPTPPWTRDEPIVTLDRPWSPLVAVGGD